MKRLLITLSAIGCLLLADPDVTGNWKLSGLKVDYLHISRETVPVVLTDVYGAGVQVPVSEVPAGALFQRFVNGPFTLPIIDAAQLNLNVNLYPDGTGVVAEGSFYPDIDLIPGTCITSPQIFPVNDEFVWELGGEHTFAPLNILGIPGLNALAGSPSWGFGVAESGVFDGWPSTPLPERVPDGLLGIGTADATLATSCTGACYGGLAEIMGVDAATCVAACSSWDYATAAAYGGYGWLQGSGSSGFIGLDQGTSQMCQYYSESGANVGGENVGDCLSTQDLTVDFLLEWNAIDGETSQSGLGDDDTDEDGDGTIYDRTFGIPYIPATFIDTTNPLCDLTGGTLTGTGEGIYRPVAGDVVDALGGEAAVGALVTGSCLAGTAAGVYDGCLGQVEDGVEAQCDAAGSPQAAVSGLCFGASQDPSLLATCDAVGVGTTVTGACLQLGFEADVCAQAAGLAEAGIADACESGVQAAAAGTCDGYGGLWNMVYGGCLAESGCTIDCDAEMGFCADTADAAVAGYGDCAGWAAVTYAGATCADAGTTDCAVLVSTDFATAMCDTIGYGLTESETCDEWAASFTDEWLDNTATQVLGTTCSDYAATLAAGLAAGDATAIATLDAAFASQAGISCTAYGAAYVGMCVVQVANTNDMYLMDPSLDAYGLFLTYNGASVQQYLAGGYTLEQIAGIAPELLVNDSAWEFHASEHYYGVDHCNEDPEAGSLDASDLANCDGIIRTGGKLVMNFEPTCVAEIEARQIVAEFVNLDDLCNAGGDANGDGTTNVVDIVRIVDHILGGDQLGGYQGCEADINGDDVINVVDVVAIVQLILGRTVENDATEATLHLDNNQISIEADGYVAGVELVVEFTGDLNIEFANNYIADYSVDGNTAHILLVSTENVEDVLTVTSGRITSITNAIIVNSNDALPTTNVSIEEPATYVVGDAFPNPFNPSTNISLELTASADISVKVYNLMGQLVDVIAEGSYSPSTYNWTWNAENLASGVYLVKTQVGSDVSTQKVMLLK